MESLRVVDFQERRGRSREPVQIDRREALRRLSDRLEVIANRLGCMRGRYEWLDPVIDDVQYAADYLRLLSAG